MLYNAGMVGGKKMCGNTKRLKFFFQFVKRFAITAEWDCKLSSLMATLQEEHALDELQLLLASEASDLFILSALQGPVATCLGPLIAQKDAKSSKSGKCASRTP